MRFSSLALLGSSLLATVGVTRAFPLEARVLEARAGCNVTSCTLALGAGFAVCGIAIGNSGLNRKLDPFVSGACIVTILNGGINPPAQCAGCLGAIQAQAKKLGIQACKAGAAVQAGAQCLLNPSAVAKACVGALCKLAGQKKGPTLPVSNQDIPLQNRPAPARPAPVRRPSGPIPPPPKAAKKPIPPPPKAAKKPAKPLTPPGSPGVGPSRPRPAAAKPAKPVVPPKPARLSVPKKAAPPPVPKKPVALQAAKVKGKGRARAREVEVDEE